MLSCKETTYLLSAQQDRHLAFGERLALRLHLLICEGCSNYRKQVGFIREACSHFKSGDREKLP